MPKDGRSDAIDFLKKKISHAFEPIAPLTSVPSGCLAVDIVSGVHGFPRGRVTEVFGLEQSGKSTVMMAACAAAQADGRYPVYIDAERGMEADHALRLGFDFQNKKKGLYLLPNTFEETLVILDTMASDGSADLVVVDSVPALVPEDVMKGEITEMGQFGQVARLFAGALPRIVKTIERTKTALVFVNQLRANIPASAYEARWAAKEKSFGGYALRYYSALRINLKQKKKDWRTRPVPHLTEAGKTRDLPVASLHSATVFKSKVAQPYQDIEFCIRYDPVADVWGIDNLQTIIDVARAKGLITSKGGGVFTFDGKTERMVARGEDQLYDWFQTHADEITHLRGQIGI